MFRTAFAAGLASLILTLAAPAGAETASHTRGAEGTLVAQAVGEPMTEDALPVRKTRLGPRAARLARERARRPSRYLGNAVDRELLGSLSLP